MLSPMLEPGGMERNVNRSFQHTETDALMGECVDALGEEKGH